ncbi:4-alpha-glucanotransferase [Parapusillimonas granuli]|uniref:4-alpha-glucanotransferase n=1 Tax=Parapusillimonas granuli TaxID=380911 RepID=A0A853FXE3_9BURK|nr:4-alpha-glucanotransferase [Parapusillimonas granuli]MBB5214795.1 4-alpha-glucanotransferase [Parapusillimonas granuli]MEB2397957.1 4-alpha-glucanotransferase [Alcaligenaceae bacterium]NYT48797.1 4-alpha-glucanotransferase [Parapusillimonas granuli]
MSRPETEALRDLARAAGLLAEWRDAFGAPRSVAPEVLAGMLARMGFPCGTVQDLRDSVHRLESKATAGGRPLRVVDAGQAIELRDVASLKYKVELESGETLFGTAGAGAPGSAIIPAIRRPGYHRLLIGGQAFALAVCPARCPAVRDLVPGGGARPWGLTAQLYSLAGEGAYAQLARLAGHAAAQGASALAISPAHAMFSADPSRFSPYSPSSRLFLNVAHIEPSSVLGPDAAASAIGSPPAEAERPDAASGSRHLHWDRIVPARLRVLRRLFDAFRTQGAEGAKREFAEFCRQGGQALRRHAGYEALHAHFSAALGPGCGWRDWPAEFHDPDGPAPRDFAQRHALELDFHMFLQWQAFRSLAGAQRAAKQAGMGIGLIADLAIGVDGRGSQVWSRQSEMLVGASVGAPPDLYQQAGQNWGLSTFSPWSLADNGYAGFLETLRAAFAHAGGLRIDHILGYGRMWLIEEGGDPVDGVYLRYPLDDMLRLLTLEAWRAGAVVIGENLGTVPEDFNDRLARRGIMGTSVLWFERRDHARGGAQDFAAAEQWPDWTMATSTTHDLPTVAGWWKGRDLYWRRRLAPPPSGATADPHDAAADPYGAAADQHHATAGPGESGVRAQERALLWRRAAPSAAAPPPAEPPLADILAFVARSPSPLFMLPLEDLLGVEEQPNIPGSRSGLEPGCYPSWMLALGADLDAMWASEGVRRTIAAVKQARARTGSSDP